MLKSDFLLAKIMKQDFSEAGAEINVAIRQATKAK